jgi:hypothetical protein
VLCQAVPLLRFCRQLRTLDVSAVFADRLRLDPAVPAAVRLNSGTLQSVRFGRVTKAALEALAECRLLTRFADEPIASKDHGATADDSTASPAPALWRSCPILTFPLCGVRLRLK